MNNSFYQSQYSGKMKQKSLRAQEVIFSDRQLFKTVEKPQNLPKIVQPKARKLRLNNKTEGRFENISGASAYMKTEADA